jgi:hypothetical protein
MTAEIPISFEELIEELIMADMKHNQLITGLRNVDLHSDDHFLGIYELITSLFGISDLYGLDRFSDVYFWYMGHGDDYPITNMGQEFRPLAKECYQALIVLAKELKEGTYE